MTKTTIPTPKIKELTQTQRVELAEYRRGLEYVFELLDSPDGETSTDYDKYLDVSLSRAANTEAWKRGARDGRTAKLRMMRAERKRIVGCR
jgi:hypothetical protein